MIVRLYFQQRLAGILVGVDPKRFIATQLPPTRSQVPARLLLLLGMRLGRA